MALVPKGWRAFVRPGWVVPGWVLPGWIVVGWLVALSASGAGFANAQDAGGRTEMARGGFLSNLALLERLSLGAIEEAVDSLRLAPNGELTVLSRTPHEANDFLLARLARVLIDRGHAVTIAGTIAAPASDSSAVAASAPAGSTPGADARERADRAQAAREAAERDASGTGAAGLDESAAPGDTTGAYADSVARAVDPLWGEPLDEEENEVENGDDGDRKNADASGEPATGGARSTEPRYAPMPIGMPLPPGNVVELTVREFGIGYPDVKRKLLFGPVSVIRVGGCYLELAHLRGPEGRLVQMSAGERHRVDRLSGQDRMLAEGAGYPFTKPALSTPSLGRYIEPAIVVGVIGSLIYLFYTNQN